MPGIWYIEVCGTTITPHGIYIRLGNPGMDIGCPLSTTYPTGHPVLFLRPAPPRVLYYPTRILDHVLLFGGR